MKILVNGMSVEITGEKIQNVRVEDGKILIEDEEIEIALGEDQVQRFLCRGDVCIVIKHASIRPIK